MGTAAIAIIAAFAYAVRKIRRTIPHGKAAIVTTLDQTKAIAGPKKINIIPLLQKIKIHDLRQTPMDVPVECVTLDHVALQLTLSVFWDARPESLVAIVNNKLDVGDRFRRLSAACLTHEIAQLTADEVRRETPHIGGQVANFLNQTVNAETIYVVKKVDVTRVAPVHDTIVESDRLKELELERLEARTRREMKYDDQISSAKSHAEELRILNEAVTRVYPRTVEHVEKIASESKPKPEV